MHLKNGHRRGIRTCDRRNFVFTRDDVRDLPVGDGHVFCQNILHAGDGEEHRRTGDDVHVADYRVRRLHENGLLLPIDDDGADVRREAVGGDDCRHGDERDAELVGAVMCKVHQRVCMNFSRTNTG